MSTGTALTPAQIAFENQTVLYIPFGEKKQLELKAAQVRNAVARPTKSGKKPTDADVFRFMKLCEARELNPFAGDAYMVGYDTKDGPEFNLITAVQALFKRAEANPQFDGMEYGVIVRPKEGGGEVVYRNGDFYLENEVLLGGWARCYRKDRGRPFFDAIKLTSFNKGFGRWNDDPGGMIVKCAQSSVLRAAFPTQLGGLYLAEEIHLHGESYIMPPQMPVNQMISDQTTAAAIPPPRTEVIDQEPIKAPTKSEKLAATARTRKPKTEPAKEAPKSPPPMENQTEIPEEAYQEPTSTAADDTQETAGEPAAEQEERDLIAEFNHGLQYCPTHQAVMKFRDTFCGPSKTHDTTEEQEREIEKIAEVEGKKRLPPAPKKKDLG